MSHEEPDRTKALDLLTGFQQRILPGMLRRLGAWKGIHPGSLREWQDDVVQELAVDCLEDAQAIVGLSERERHARWMRRAEAVIYRLRRGHSSAVAVLEETAAPSPHPELPPDLDLPPLVTLHNGRTNLLASIRQSGQSRRQLRQHLDDLAAKLGWDQEQMAFWQARVVEAITGLAADLLLEHNTIRPLTPLPKANLSRRRARLRRLGRRFPIQPPTREIRTVLKPWIRRNNDPEPTPRRLLEQAVRLAPDSGPAWLWLFEACCLERDAVGATRAVLRARRCTQVTRAAIVLARARVQELRGRWPAATRLLERARLRGRGDQLLDLAAKLLGRGNPTTTERS